MPRGVAKDVADARVAVDDSLREDELEVLVGVLQRGQCRGEEGAVAGAQPGVGVDPLGGVGERCQWRQVQVFRGNELVQPGEDAAAISGVLAYWSPSSERACQNVTMYPSVAIG